MEKLIRLLLLLLVGAECAIFVPIGKNKAATIPEATWVTMPFGIVFYILSGRGGISEFGF
jgi:hypothetical protein